MASNSFNALVSDVNEKISEMNTTISNANSAGTAARDAANLATENANDADAAMETVSSIAEDALIEATAWQNMNFATRTLDAGSSADVSVTESDGREKTMEFKIPRGKDGAAGAKGDTGRSGVTFTLSGSKLYITTG